MKRELEAVTRDLSTLAEDARALMAATADVAGEKVGEAREHLAVALERVRNTCNRVHDEAVDGTKAADQAVREHPYQAIGAAFGLGAFIGYMLTRRCSRKCE